MRTLRVLTGFVLILLGLGALAAYGWNNQEELSEYEKKWTFNAADLHQLHLVSEYSTDVTFVKSSDGTNSVYLKGQGSEKMIAKTMNTEISGGMLDLALTRDDRRFFTIANFRSTKAKQEMTIAVTDNTVLDKLQLDNDSGNVNVNNAAVTQLGDVEIMVDSGNIEINNFKAKQLKLQIDSGNVTADGIAATLNASADSGNIKIRNFAGKSKLSVDSGNIKLYKQDTADTDISADSGNVYVEMPSSFAGFYDLQVDSGKIDAPESKRETNEYVKVRADSGNITIEEK